jgi:hypothetical protein
MNHTQKPLEIGMLLYPGLTLLDLIGPHTVLAWFANIHLVWKTTDLIRTDTGIGVKPNATFATCPRELDILFVPGGFGQQNLMADTEVIRFLADRGARAKYVPRSVAARCCSARPACSRATRRRPIGRRARASARSEPSPPMLAWWSIATGSRVAA